jgi:hypothetical protein
MDRANDALLALSNGTVHGATVLHNVQTS